MKEQSGHIKDMPKKRVLPLKNHEDNFPRMTVYFSTRGEGSLLSSREGMDRWKHKMQKDLRDKTKTS